MRLPCGRLRREEAGYILDADDGLLRVFLREHAQKGTYRLSRIVDARGNMIRLAYSAAGLETILDSAGRTVRVRRHPGGRIAAFEVQGARRGGAWTGFRTYRYDERGDLVEAIDAEGHAERFTYDDDHRLHARATPGGLVAEFRYDAEGRGIETWCHRITGESGLAEGAPATLADRTRAKGFLHVKIDYGPGFSEVVNSRTVRRVHGNAFGKADKMTWASAVHTQTFDAAGELATYADGEGQTYGFERDERGRLIKVTDPLGGSTSYAYDERGLLAESIDAEGDATIYTRDTRGDLLALDDAAGRVADLRYDGRGLLTHAVLPNGGVTTMRYDEQGNRVELVEPDGAARRLRYDDLGWVRAYLDERGHETTYGYDAMGRLVSVRGPTGATTHYGYDADGDLVRITDPDGRSTELIRGGFHVVTAVQRPDGTRVSFTYDREQDLARIVNEAGEEHRFERDLVGRIREERTFDGRVLRYARDLQGRVTQIRHEGSLTELVYDACGRLVARKHEDELVETLEYDRVGRLVAASRGESSCRFVRDARGNIVREETTFGGAMHKVEARYDALGKRTSLRSSTGLSAEYQNDVVGRPVSVAYGDIAPMSLAYDAAGLEIERRLPGGGRVATAFSADGRPRRLSVLGPPRLPYVAPGEPAWVGPLPDNETLRRGFDFSPGGDLRAIETASEGLERFEHDRVGRVLERARPRGSAERFHFGPGGELHDATAARTYGAGGRLVERGGVTYRYDVRGRLVERAFADASGRARLVQYEWDASGMLSAVVGPEEERVSFTYNPFARLLQKTVHKARQLCAVTRYAWDGPMLLQSLEQRRREDGSTAHEERSYAYVPGLLVPAAQRVRRDGQDAPWEQILSSRVNLFPEALLGGDGSVRARLTSSLFGAMEAASAARTDLRLPGQLADRDTGLTYNQFRWYDAEAGGFLSPEPIGLEGGLMAYAYAGNRPLAEVDPDGLAKTVVTSTVTGTVGSFSVPSGHAT